MKEKLETQIKRLNGMRDEVLAIYLEKLEFFSVKDGSYDAVERAGILHDLDKHISNLEMELKRIESIEGLELFRAQQSGTSTMEVIRG